MAGAGRPVRQLRGWHKQLMNYPRLKSVMMRCLSGMYQKNLNQKASALNKRTLFVLDNIMMAGSYNM